MRTYTEEQARHILSIIEQWQHSGMSQATCCREQGVKPSTFQYWRKRYDPDYGRSDRNVPQESSSSGFIPVQMGE